MSTHNIQLLILKRKSSKIIPNTIVAMDLFCKGLQNEFEIVVVHEPSVFEPLKFYCTSFLTLLHSERPTP